MRQIVKNKSEEVLFPRNIFEINDFLMILAL